MAEHRGGPLKKKQHAQLMEWACGCSERVLPLLGKSIDERLTEALRVAREWVAGNASVGEARKASLGAIAAARESSNPTATAVARAVGHAVATAHMADHSLGAARYAVKAAANAGGSAEAERRWQNDRLPAGIRRLVLSARKTRLGER